MSLILSFEFLVFSLWFLVLNHPSAENSRSHGLAFFTCQFTFSRKAPLSEKKYRGELKTRPCICSKLKTLRMNGHYRTKGPGHHLVGHTAEEDPLQALAAVGAHDDEIDVLLFGQLQDLFRR